MLPVLSRERSQLLLKRRRLMLSALLLPERPELLLPTSREFSLLLKLRLLALLLLFTERLVPSNGRSTVSLPDVAASLEISVLPSPPKLLGDLSRKLTLAMFAHPTPERLAETPLLLAGSRMSKLPKPPRVPSAKPDLTSEPVCLPRMLPSRPVLLPASTLRAWRASLLRPNIALRLLLEPSILPMPLPL